MNNVLAVSGIFYDEPTVEKWVAAKAAGLMDTELSLSASLPIEGLLDKGERQYAMYKAAEIAISSAHLPFGPAWEISSMDDGIQQNAIQGYRQLIRWISDKGIDMAVLHPSYEPIDPSTRAAQLQRATAAIEKISGFAREHGVRIAVENLPRTCLGNCAADMLTLTQNGQAALMCFDVNHLLLETHEAFFPQIAPHVITTHLSDYDRINERHWLPGEGVIDWANLIRLFAQYGYDGRLLFEVREHCRRNSDEAVSPLQLVERFQSIIR